MKKLSTLIAGLCLTATIAIAAPAFADHVTISGSVVRYEPGRVIVVRGADAKEVTYTLAPNIVVPPEVKVGGTVTLFAEPNPSGGMLVRRVTTTSVTPGGEVQETTEETRTTPSGGTQTTTTTRITGRVAAYEAGKTLTLIRDDGSRVTYVINAQSQVPAELVVGKTISVVPVVSSDPNVRVVRTVTISSEPPGQN